MARLTANPGTPEARVFELQPGSNRLGRAPGNDHVFPEPSISSSHCELVVSDIAVLVRDLASTNGTFIDEQPIKEKIIQRGQTLRLGKVPFLFEAEEARISIPELSPQDTRHNVVLEDGSILCANHPDLTAAWKCPKCDFYLCDQCVHHLGLKGGAKTTFCAECSVPCQPFSPAPRKQKPKGLLGVLGGTLRMFKNQK